MKTTIPQKLCGLFLTVLGGLVLLIAADLVPVDPNRVHAPAWILALAGLLVAAGGLILVTGGEGSLGPWLGGTVVLSMTVLTAWIALFGPSEGFSGTLPFLSEAQDVLVSRVVFGCVALLGLAITAGAIRRSFSRGDD